MTLGNFLEVYDCTEPFWINYPDEAGYYDAAYFEGSQRYRNWARNVLLNGGEPIFWEFDEIYNVTHGDDGILTIELKYEEV